MACNACENKDWDGDRDVPVGEEQYVCWCCQQRWWSYNTHYNLWTTVDDDFTWDVLRHGVDIPISIGKPASVLPGYEDYAVKPTHKICEERSPYPKLVLMDGPSDMPTAAIQCVGDWERGNIFQHQFLFPLGGRLPDEDWMAKEKLDTFHVPFVGTVSHWPYEDRPEGLFEDAGEKAFAHLISDRLRINGNQASFIVPLVFLGDPSVGVITARHFFDDYIREVAVEKFQ